MIRSLRARIATAVSIGVFIQPLHAFSQTNSLPSKINIYCTSNLDGTGQCFEVKTNTLLKCTGVPGEIIPCRVPGGASYNCIFFSAALLACNQSLARSIEQRAEKIQNKSPFENDFDDVLSEQLVDPVDKAKGDKSVPVQSQSNQTPPSTPNAAIRPIILPTW